MHPQRQAANLRPHYSKADYGDFYIETGALIGHEAVDVSAWLEAHPEYSGSISFERWDFEGGVDVTDVFRDPDAEAVNTNVEMAA